MMSKTVAPGKTDDLLTTKTHYAILDGMRGVAALAVVVFHFMEMVVPHYSQNFIAHGYLAVDFFFCLSGFVIAYAYDKRMKEMSAFQFFKLRLIRLQPLVVIGAILGLLGFLLDPFKNLYDTSGLGKTILMLLSAGLMIPYPAVPERYYNLFQLNPPTWSLFWEYVANIFYAVVLFKIRNKLLWLLTIIAALLLCYTAYFYKNLSVGWSSDNYPAGFARVFYSFLAGMLVYRSRWIIRTSLGFISVGLLLLLAFLVPYRDNLNHITEPLLVIFYFPFLVALGAGAQLRTQLKKACKFMGELSYPLYMVHYPFLWVFYSYIETHKTSLRHLKMMVPVFTILLIVLAYLILVFVDAPVRKYFKERMKKNLKAV